MREVEGGGREKEEGGRMTRRPGVGRTEEARNRGEKWK